MIALQDVHFAYQDTEVLRGISLHASAGKLLVLLGPNGCGKTTTLRVMSGYLAPSRGQAFLCGRPVVSYTPRERARLLALIPQRASIQFDFRVQQVVEMGRSPYHGRMMRQEPRDIQAVRNAMEMTGVWDMRNQMVTALSGGELQRVMIARALAQQSQVLLMDEPVSHLDVRHRAEILALARKLAHRQGLCVVCVLHDLELAGAFADEVVLMHAGQVVACGENALQTTRIQEVFGVDATVSYQEGFPRISVQYQAYRE